MSASQVFRRWLMVGVSVLFLSPLFAGEDRGTFSLDSRLRFEQAEIDGVEDADNLSLRLRPGYLSPEWQGFQFMAKENLPWLPIKILTMLRAFTAMPMLR